MVWAKLGSIMGSYLNIHLNLSPVYVLLLLLTLSHGRPSARIREPRYSKNLIRDSNSIISSLSNFHSSRLGVVNESSSSISRTNSLSRYYRTHNNIGNSNSYPSKAVSRKTDESGKGTTGSWYLHRNPPYLSNRISSEVGLEPAEEFHSNRKNLGFDSKLKAGKDKKNGKISKWNESGVLSLTSPRLDDGDEDEVAGEEDPLLLADKSPTDLLMGQAGNNNRYRQVQEIVDEDETDEMGSPEDKEQLDKYRANILKELGFQPLKKDDDGPTSAGYLLDIPTPIVPKWNISREEYIGAYAQYMHNVKERKEKARAHLGPRNRRKNAVTSVQTYYDNGSDHLMSEGGVMRTFSFDVNAEAKTAEGIIRVRRATLSIPASCSLINGFRGRSSLRVEGNNISSVEGMESEDDNDVTYDLTEDVASWLAHADSSPFEVTVYCSDVNGGRQNSTSSTPRWNGSLRVVSAESPGPTDRSRSRRSAQKSTLRNFENKQGKGRDCTKTRRGKTCCRRSLKVKFSDLGISDVIIEPQEFDAHVCVGKCNAKRVAYATTHAMFQHIIHQTKGKAFAPRPCCTPTKLTELDVIHLDPTGTKLQVTVLKNAIVEECGCS